ncbi:MAG TPA: prolipoprotein diacylglyceryl transferase [Polyangiaceae bacterium]|nr:prolipoprotein diacylglyceryl transferase [Polyangiaceae bacterium]
MHPILFRIPMPGWDLPIVGKVDAIPIYAYGVMLGLSLVAGWYLTLGLCKRDGLPRETMANNYVITAIVAVVMSRVLYVVTNPEEFNTTWEIISFRGGGLVAYGGFIGGFLGSFAYLRYKRIPLLPWADVAVPSLAIGTAITRIGCYLFGCDYGRPLAENAPGWVKKLGTFPRWSADVGIPGSPAWSHHTKANLIDITADHSLPVHPTQLYEMLIGAGLLAFLLWARKRQTFRGQIFFLWAFIYGFLRFLLEIVRDDPERGSLPGSLPEHIFLPLCLLLFAVGYAVSFANMIPNVTVRRVTQVAAFLPPIVAFFWLKPAAFATPVLMQLSSSQGIALASIAVCGFYFVYDKAAREHPEAAMDLNLPESEMEEEPRVEEPQADEAKAKDETPAEPAKKKTKKKKKKRAAGA